MPVFVCHRYLLYDFLNILVSVLHNAIHLWSVMGRIVMLDLELFTEFSDHRIVDICTIICDDSLWNTIPTDKVMLDEPCHNILNNSSKRGILNPLSEVINGH